ncbi:MAG TPA: HisA/HisF-related TIM barrel protein [Anaerolineae bacterium]
MRVIPVIDLKEGIAVHAVRGERAGYRPVTGALVTDGHPQRLALALRERLGLNELYVADLDAIAGLSPQAALIADLAAAPGLNMMVDAGTGDPAQVGRILALGVPKVVIGLETLASEAALAAIFAVFPPERLVFSLDLRGGRVLATDAALAACDPLDLLARVAALGCREAILLDLARVGTGAGADRELVAAAQARCPGIALLAGGGVRNVTDLRDLRATGAAGALVATALHNAAIGRTELTAIGAAA